MASLKDVKEYLEAPPLGRKLPLNEMKELSTEERAELVEMYDALPESERERF